MCRCSPKIMFYMISHNNIFTVLETLWDVEKTCLSQHTGGTTAAIFNVLDCESRDPVLVEIRFKNSFYGHSFPIAVSIRAAISFLRQSRHSATWNSVDRLIHLSVLESSIRLN